MLVLGGKKVYSGEGKKQCWFGLYQRNWLGVYVNTPLPGIFVMQVPACTDCSLSCTFVLLLEH